ncbi:hypothetical protein BN2476_810067 [Paraburkholderia piptadeniae]|uniref:Uncharacterized protein n=1 Tax=Paraburkholderia piptadeniae TaxID=1701573 RepID=A0A1N7SST8_9BURK|nr:hypothetical protein BN2476_810067 [Paraburkholderia piptadeniae]
MAFVAPFISFSPAALSPHRQYPTASAAGHIPLPSRHDCEKCPDSRYAHTSAAAAH